MDFINRHRNLIVLAAVLFAQVLGLAVQVRRPSQNGPVRLVHFWGVSLMTPGERAVVGGRDGVVHLWRNYFYLRDVRRENAALEQENLRLRLEQVRLAQDASQAQRLQALLKFKEQFISDTVAAQVIGTSGTEQSRLLTIDKGAQDGIGSDMAVITPDGIVGKVVRVMQNASQVLEINDQSSGVGAILEKSRLQGIVKGSMAGEVMLHYVMGDEKVEDGEMALTSGGDRIFPKGLPIGQIVQVSPGADTFLRIRIRPASRLDRVEEVLVITRVVEKDREAIPEVPMRAAEILAQRLPMVPPKPVDTKPAEAPGAAASPAPAAANGTAKPVTAKPEAEHAANAKVPAAGGPGAAHASAKPTTVAQPATGAPPQAIASKPAAGSAPTVSQQPRRWPGTQGSVAVKPAVDGQPKAGAARGSAAPADALAGPLTPSSSSPSKPAPKASRQPPAPGPAPATANDHTD